MVVVDRAGVISFFQFFKKLYHVPQVLANGAALKHRQRLHVLVGRELAKQQLELVEQRLGIRKKMHAGNLIKAVKTLRE